MLSYTLIFVDGENLTLRYQEMLAAGRIPRPDTLHVKDAFVWNNRVLFANYWHIKRLSYYTSVIGDETRVRSVRDQLARTTYQCTIDRRTNGAAVNKSGQIIPFVRKKLSRSRKESICDIAITVDVMRACYRDHADAIWIFSGDGDFIQLIYEVVHSGKTVYVSGFSSGLNEELPYVVDEFFPIDDHFFLTAAEVAEAEAAARGAPPELRQN